MVLPTANQGMQSGGNETTASGYEDVAHHPGPFKDIPSWISYADYENHKQRQAETTQNFANKETLPPVTQKEVPLKTYTMRVGTSITGSPFCVIGTANILENKEPAKVQNAEKSPTERPMSPHERSLHISQANTTDSASNGWSTTTWCEAMFPLENICAILHLDSCFHSTCIHVIDRAQIAWCDNNALMVIDILQSWILLQQKEAVSLADKHKILYFLRTVSELVSRLYLKFDVSTVKQLWKALFSTYPYVQCCRKNLRVALTQLRSLYEGCERLSLAKSNCQCLNKLKFFSAVSSEWNALLSAQLRSCRQRMPPIIPGFADCKLKDLTVPTASFIGIHNDNLLDSISDPASLWCHIVQHLGSDSLPRPLTDLELSLAMTQAGTPTSASFPQPINSHPEIVQPVVTRENQSLHSFNATLQHWS